MMDLLAFGARGVILGLISFKPAHCFTYLIESSEKWYSVNFIRSSIRASTRLRLCQAIPAIPATLNFWFHNPDVTILDSSSNKLSIGAFF